MKTIILEELREIKALIHSNSIKKYLTMKDLVDMSRLSSSTIRRAILSGRLKVSRRGKKLLFSKENVEKWLSE